MQVSVACQILYHKIISSNFVNIAKLDEILQFSFQGPRWLQILIKTELILRWSVQVSVACQNISFEGSIISLVFGLGMTNNMKSKSLFLASFFLLLVFPSLGQGFGEIFEATFDKKWDGTPLLTFKGSVELCQVRLFIRLRTVFRRNEVTNYHYFSIFLQQFCAKEILCAWFNYHPEQWTCELHPTDSALKIAAPGWRAYDELI